MSTSRWLLALGVAICVGQHLGALPGGLGDAGGRTLWVDWIDLLTPYAVVGSALLALASAGTSRRGWLLAGTGGIAYVQGHGIHLSANSIGNARGEAAPVHLWDEVVGHWLWYAGLALLLAALVPAARRAGVGASLLGLLVAAGVGLTWATNALEGGTAVGSLLVAAGFTGWGWRLRADGAGRLLLAAFPLAVVVLAGWGVVHGGWPQPSEL
jgi:hypothetical protein